MRENNFTEQIRQKLIKMAPVGMPVKVTELALELDLISDKQKRPLYKRLEDMRRSGEVERRAPGVVAYIGKDEPPDIRSGMWSVIRMRKVVTVDDLCELTSASKNYAKTFVQMLVRRGCLERIERKGASAPSYRLVTDVGPQTPEDTIYADRVRRIREAKQKAIEQLDEAGQALVQATHAIVRARMAVNDISEEAGDGDE